MTNPPLIIAGSGRSGTTWVLDCIAHANNLRTIFEPLQPIGVPEAKSMANLYLRENENHPELKAFMDRVFTGELNRLWANYRVRPDRFTNNFDKPLVFKFYCKKLFLNYLKFRKIIKRDRLIIKFTRANLMLDWISNNFQTKIVLMIRHPCAVIASRINRVAIESKNRGGVSDWSYENLLKIYLNDKKLFNDHLFRYRALISNSLSSGAAHCLIWCIENMIPLSSNKKKDFCVVFYEDLLTNAIKKWRRITEFFGLEHIPDPEIIGQPSQQVSREMRDRSFNEEQLGKWMKIFSKEELADIEEVLNAFNVPFYNVHNPMPLVDN